MVVCLIIMKYLIPDTPRPLIRLHQRTMKRYEEIFEPTFKKIDDLKAKVQALEAQLEGSSKKEETDPH